MTAEESKASGRDPHPRAGDAGEPLPVQCTRCAAVLGNGELPSLPPDSWRHEEERPQESTRATSLEKGNPDFHSCAPSSASDFFDVCVCGSEGSLRASPKGERRSWRNANVGGKEQVYYQWS